MGNGESSLTEDWSQDDYDEMSQNHDEYNEAVNKYEIDNSETNKAKMESARKKYEQSKRKFNLSLDRVFELPDGTVSKIDWSKWKTDPGIDDSHKQKILTKTREIGAKAKKAFIKEMRESIRKLGGDPDNLFKVDKNGKPLTEEDRQKMEDLENDIKKKKGSKIARTLISLLAGLAALAGNIAAGVYLFEKLENILGCPAAKTNSGCFAIDPKTKQQDKVLFITDYVTQCDYDNLCGDGDEGSGCDKGTPSGSVATCCSGITDSLCGKADSDGKCSQSGTPHFGWSYTAICQDSGQGLGDILDALKNLIGDGVKGFIRILIIGGIVMAVILGFMGIKFLLSHLSMGKKK